MSLLSLSPLVRAQTPVPTPTPAPTPAPPKQDSVPDPRAPKGTGNPLSLSDTRTADGQPTIYYDERGNRIVAPKQGQHDFVDYTKGATPGKFSPTARPLAFFAYNFFEYPRQVILARRAYLQRLYDTGNINRTGETLAPAANGTNAAAVLPLAEGTRGAVASDAGNGVIASAPPTTGTGGSTGPALQFGDGSSQAVDAFREFADPLSQLSRNVSAVTPSNYVLAPGDQITVRYSSPTMSQREFNRTVDSLGTISIDGLGKVSVVGLTMERAEEVLTRKLAVLYRSVRAELALKELRTINVTLTGDAFSPGTYTVPGVTTAFNLLYAAGGPTEDGTLRRIEVRRRGRIVAVLDFYKFLLGGQDTPDTSLESGDVINISPRLSRVEVEGEVRRPAVYELTPTETLTDALRYAGNVKPSGIDQRVQITTVIPGASRVLRDIDLRKSAQVSTTPVYDGDRVTAFSVRETLTNQVTVEGAVDQPGEYAVNGTFRVADLVRQARGLQAEAYLNRADLYRWRPDNSLELVRIDLEKALAGDPNANIALRRWDRLKVYTRSEVEFAGRRVATVRGAVQRPGLYDRTEGMRLRDLLLLAGGPTVEAYRDRAYLLHQHPDGTFAYDIVNMDAALRGDAAYDVAIEDNDVLAVYRTEEATFQPEHLVRVQGEVVSPGIYPRGTGMKVSEALQLAGGLRPGASGPVTVAHARRSVNDASETKAQTVPVAANGQVAPGDDLVLLDGDVVTIQGNGAFKERVEIVYVHGAVNRPGPVILTSNKMRLSDAIAQAGGLRQEAFPEGAEFLRNDALLASAGQRSLTSLVSQLNDLLNKDAYQRELAKADVERIKVTGAAVTSNNNVSIPGLPTPASTSGAAAQAVAALSADLGKRDLVSPPRVLDNNALNANGNIAVNLPAVIRKPGGDEDLLLVNGDVITVPETPSTVQVVGAVINGRGVLYKADANADYYIANVGGMTVDAAKDRAVVISYGGGIQPLNKVKKIRPGDVVFIPTKVLAAKILSRGNDFERFFQNITGPAITVRVLQTLLGL